MANGIFYMYLRKSRKDIEAEKHGEGETLARHEKVLNDLAGRMHIKVAQTFREIVSGETISARPQIQSLLSKIEDGHADGVLVMEVERLARGDMEDQGTILKAFKYSGTKIITPVKIYDPTDECDEDYFEFGLFMSRKEYKTIKRRMQSGRLISSTEGKFCGNKAPYGYERIKIPNEKGYTLKIIPKQAEVVRLIFDLFLNGASDNQYIPLGPTAISLYLYQHDILSLNGGRWSPNVIRELLKNPVYMGKIRWGYQPAAKAIKDGKEVTVRKKQDQYPIYDGLHDGIISEEWFWRAHERLKGNGDNRGKTRQRIKNPYSGLLICGMCKHAMYRISARKGNAEDSFCCRTPGCCNVSSKAGLIEIQISEFLQVWLDGYYVPEKQDEPNIKINQIKKMLQKTESDIKVLMEQRDKICDLLEQGIYTDSIYCQRIQSIQKKIEGKETIRNGLMREKNFLAGLNGQEVAKGQSMFEFYQSLEEPAAKNAFLKEVLVKVEYTKAIKNSCKNGNDNIFLKFYPRWQMAQKID